MQSLVWRFNREAVWRFNREVVWRFNREAGQKNIRENAILAPRVQSSAFEMFAHRRQRCSFNDYFVVTVLANPGQYLFEDRSYRWYVYTHDEKENTKLKRTYIHAADTAAAKQ